MSLLADFHNHSCLSPCGSLDLSPRALAELAAGRGVKVLALTDHNSSLNCPAFAKVCPPRGILPLFGMEATTQEEIHFLCLFTSLEACMDFNEYAYNILLPFPNDPEKTGDQVYVDEDDNIEGEVEYYLINPIDLTADTIGPKVSEYGGIVIPAHVERPAFSMMSQLGVIVEGPWAALEFTRLPPVSSSPLINSSWWGVNSPDNCRQEVDALCYPLITSSDAHYPEHVARRPFELDICMEQLAPDGLSGKADMGALIEALAKRVTNNTMRNQE